jgi:RNA polymerase sigma-70 factor (ECF subfamily)
MALSDIRSSAKPAFTRDLSHFALTRWSLVLAAKTSPDPSRATRAMGELCQIYWQPLYSYLRRRGHAAPAAEDLTQEFFARLLANPPFSRVNQENGRFRSFLLASIKHFLANEWDRDQTQKRGGGKVIISFDALTPEARQAIEPAGDLPPDKAFERQWALTVLEQVLARLRQEFVQSGKEPLFATLKPFLTGNAETYAAAAAHCGMSESALKVAVHRLRQRYRKLLREEIAETVDSPEEVEAEIRALFAALS